ncbi:MAG TPA: periplasmic heavy metal sensor [Chitinispirillaceae bacterium]|nr:periplasmic heavy metal sensor [Chitinispirillaceae bacterium]
MNVRTILISGLTIAFLGASVFAQKGPCHEKAGPGCFWSDMKLTAEQQEKLKTLHSEMQEVKKAHKGEVITIRKKIADELLKDTPSTESLDSYSKELGDLHAKMTRERYTHLLKVKQILTAEQFKAMISRENSDGPGGYHHGRMEPGKNECIKKHASGCCPKGEAAKPGCNNQANIE